ncbi:hypothetical protein EPUL_004197 [Erysiphe pulchra]|uniref:Reverse transcriptase domain-containing protein n=1 Tax=Erysiphe pulchra TaxID=225359 RepID=A0A2S4PQT6_9PEZI|nr:hypothetical protein EPUL_004197 [Erysiphe pulchra]
MLQESDVDMGDDNQIYQASENQSPASSSNDSAPSWISYRVRFSTHVIRNQPSQLNSQPLEQTPWHSKTHPKKFSVNDPSLYSQFLSLLEAKLRIDAKAIGSEEESLTASRRIHPWIEYAKDIDKFTIKEFSGRLDSASGDIENITKAINKLNRCVRGTIGFDGKVSLRVDEVLVVDNSSDGHRQSQVFLYITQVGQIDMTLGRVPWTFSKYARINDPRSKMKICSTGAIVYSNDEFNKNQTLYKKPVQISAATFDQRAKRSTRNSNRTPPATKLQLVYHKFLDVFDHNKADLPSPSRRHGVDHAIEIKKINVCESKAPWEPVNSILRDEFLILRKTLSDLPDEEFIKKTAFRTRYGLFEWLVIRFGLANARSIFQNYINRTVRDIICKNKSGGLRLCVDYCALNDITQKDRYSLPLIRETLRLLAQAKWISKVDVRSAFHRLRVAEVDEWKSAFQTRFGSFEWLVTPFGLAGASAAFQRWINQSLGKLLEKKFAAYLDNVIIFLDGDINDHWIKVKHILGLFSKVGLKLDQNKKIYLRFIIKVGDGLKVDPDKIEEITS